MIRWDPICASQHDTGLDLSGTGSSETMHDGGDRRPNTMKNIYVGSKAVVSKQNG